MRLASTLALSILAVLPGHSRAESRTDAQVFGMWVYYQHVRSDLRFTDLAAALDEEAVRYAQSQLPASTVTQLGLSLPTLRALYGTLDGSVGDFVRYLGEHGVARGDRGADRAILSALMTQRSKSVERRAWFGFGNRLFEYGFSPRTFPELRSLIAHRQTHRLVKMLYEGMWYSLSRIGWSDWHQGSLTAIEQAARARKEIVYIAGGTDLYRPILWRAHRLRVIDPMFPSQKHYYSEGWEYLLRGKIGDEIVFTREMRGLRLVRTSYTEAGNFTTDTLSDGTRATLPQSTTVWTFREPAGKDYGELVFERRFVRQEDFRTDARRALLLSFNELYFIVTPGPTGWGIDVRRFPAGLDVIVKQLRAPVTWEMLQNLRTVQESSVPFVFGSAVK